MKPHRVALVWFRRDLRLTDNPALDHAVDHADAIVPVYVHAPDGEDAWSPGAASRWWLHHSLGALDAALRDRGTSLTVRTGDALAALQALIGQTGASLLTCNRLYEPAGIARDARIETALAHLGVEVVRHNGSLLMEPEQLRNAQQQPYRVFTPFWRALQAKLSAPTPSRAPRRLKALATPPSSASIDALRLLPTVSWDAGLAARWQPGEASARRRLRTFVDHVENYPGGRDLPGTPGTSSLSPHLHFGEIGPRQILAELQPRSAGEGAAAFARQLGWREFAHHLLFHFPHTSDEPLDRRFARMPWRRAPAQLRAWQRGLTGCPIVDAGMRELWLTGWMHNRVRMITASFLTKNLQIHWLEGARWFWDTLVDADLANNTLGWQWTAGCGADAAPYYRIFNPVLQAEKFDPERTYIRKWLPELASLPDRWIHQPWAAPRGVLAGAGVKLGSTYPKPVVDLRSTRNAALMSYQRIQQSAQRVMSITKID